MNIDPVSIDDDDVDMEPVVILDEDDETIICERAVGVPSMPTVETIVLDDESPIITGGTVNNNAAIIINKQISMNKSETSFINNLNNNRLMDKIVKRCINMENATGMPRVVYKTLLPLYRDTDNTFKESDRFRALLKKTYKLLMRDPDHKFLHVKTLCEELKSGGLRRKVPFVTLATNLKKNGPQWDHKELTSSSREINQNKAENGHNHKIYKNKNKTRKTVCGTGTKRKAKTSKSCGRSTKYRIKTRSASHAEKEKTDIIDLDDSETESLDRSANDDDQNDVIIIEETEPSDQRNDNVKNKQETLESESKKCNRVVQETLEAEFKKCNRVVQETLEADSSKENKVVQETIEEDSNKENNDENGKSSDNEMDYELLIPKNHVHVSPKRYEVSHNSTNDVDKIARLEKQIANYKKIIDKLEETEVITESPFASPYYLCSKYKENVVTCYKQICELKGNCKDIVKRREIRLIVAEGHPPGPAKRLEEFLNSTINRTGAVEFPDFCDVVKCVVESNWNDKLVWNRQQVMQEAVALFRQCGQALRKRRQKREYRDLLSLIRDNEETDDPAEKDPILFAKLEENKLIAKTKEEELLERYVSMENNVLPGVGVPQVGNAVEFESDQDSSSSDSESEQNMTLPTTSTINNQPHTGECSSSNISLSLLRTNNIIVTSTFRNNHCDPGQSSKTNDVTANYFNVNPTLLKLLITPEITQNHVEGTATNENQCATGESSIINDTISNNSVLPTNTINFTPDTMHNECELFACLDKEEIVNSKLELTITETVVGFNNATINENSDMTSINNMKNVENTTESPADNEHCNANDVQDNVSSISNEGVEVKSEVVKREPLDIQNMLDELGDGFVCQVFDIEDPFLVIEISSDGFTDDDELQ